MEDYRGVDGAESGHSSDGVGGPRSSAPVFKKCVRCHSSLRGLPANHACPECGLRFDERCELIRIGNPKQVVNARSLHRRQVPSHDMFRLRRHTSRPGDRGYSK